MLQTLREQSNRWYIKVLFILLVISFGMWGVADMVLNYVNMRPVATVDGHSVTQEEFAGRLQSTVTRAQEASKGRLTPDQIKEIGIPQKILDSLIDHVLLVGELKKRNLVVTDDVLRRRIQSIPAFLNEKGTFDKRAFDYLLHNNHITESQFVADTRTELQQHQLFGAMMAGIQLPKVYTDLLFRGFFEQRVFAVVTVPLKKMVVKETPKTEDLEKFYQQNQSHFTVPEMRKVTMVSMDPKLLKDQITVSSEKVQEEYDRRKSEFEVAEKRYVKQIDFKEEAIAQKAVDSLKKGRPASAVARDHSAEFKDLGLVTKQQVPDLVADRVFEGDLGEIFGPISTPFGWQVYEVSKIEPGFLKPLTEVRSQLEMEIKAQLANDQLYERKNKIEDSLAGGASIEEIAKEHGFKVITIEALSKAGQDEKEKSVLPEADKAELLEQIFALTENSESSVVDVKGGLSYIVHVDAIKPSHVPEFTKIKDRVLKAWTEEKQLNLSLVVAQQLVKDAHSASDLSRMALSRQLSIKMLDPLSRVDAEKDKKIHEQFTPKFVAQMFELKSNKATFGLSPDRSALQVAMIQKILPLNEKALKDKREQMEKKLSELAYQDAVALYMANLRSSAKVSVNQGVYDTIANRG